MLNGDYKEEITDNDYRETRLDKIIPFAPASIKNPECPDDKQNVQLVN